MTDILPTAAEAIRYTETDLAFLGRAPRRFRCGFYMICTRGRGVISTGIERYVLEEQVELFFFTGSLMQLVEASADFTVRMVLFSGDVYMKTALPIDPLYFKYADEHPCYRHTPDERSQRTWREMVLWMDVARMLFSDDSLRFRSLHEENFLQSLLMWMFGTIQDKIEIDERFTRRQMLYHRFARLVREHVAREHKVEFYARKMCVTPRYLYEITMQHMAGKTPKQLIDEQLLAEVKVMLNDPHLTVTQIAEQLGFADQSYLSRFFKKHTGLSPKSFRAKKDFYGR